MKYGSAIHQSRSLARLYLKKKNCVSVNVLCCSRQHSKSQCKKKQLFCVQSVISLSEGKQGSVHPVPLFITCRGVFLSTEIIIIIFWQSVL